MRENRLVRSHHKLTKHANNNLLTIHRKEENRILFKKSDRNHLATGQDLFQSIVVSLGHRSQPGTFPTGAHPPTEFPCVEKLEIIYSLHVLQKVTINEIEDFDR